MVCYGIAYHNRLCVPHGVLCCACLFVCIVLCCVHVFYIVCVLLFSNNTTNTSLCYMMCICLMYGLTGLCMCCLTCLYLYRLLYTTRLLCVGCIQYSVCLFSLCVGCVCVFRCMCVVCIGV